MRTRVFPERSYSRYVLGAIAALLIAGIVSVAPGNEAEEDYPHGDFDEDCSLCHGDDSWKPLDLSEEFVHGDSGFRLDGAHKGVYCTVCHGNLDFTTQRSACVECHEDVHRAELGIDCGQCHTTTTFIERPAQLRAHRTTRFPLSGAHVTLDCQSCHRLAPSAAPVYVGTPTECEACHLSDYQATRSPDHAASGFSTDCAGCHTAIAWEDARFDHANTDFPLTGSHIGLSCAACHADRVYDGKPTDCYSCHQTDYDSSSDPNHRAAGFPIDCAACHNTIRWEDAEFDHDSQYFPIYSGKHREKWNRCSDCHYSPDNYSAFSCIDCHEHRRDKMQDEHKEVPGYSYDSQACYQCHPDGRGE